MKLPSDLANRAYYLTIVDSEWLGLRLNLMGDLIILIIALIGVGSRRSIGPSQVGLLLSFALQMSQLLVWMFRQVRWFFETEIVREAGADWGILLFAGCRSRKSDGQMVSAL